MMKRILACTLCLMLLLSVLPTAAAAELQTVRLEGLGLRMQLPKAYECLTLELPENDPLWRAHDREEFLQEYEEYGTYLSAYSSKGILFEIATYDSFLPDLDLLSEDAILEYYNELLLNEDAEIYAEPTVHRTEDAVYYTVGFVWISEDGYSTAFRQFHTACNGVSYNFYFCCDASMKEELDEETFEILSTVTIDRDTFDPSGYQTTTVEEFAYSITFPASYTYKNPELPADDPCWDDWDKEDYLDWAGDSVISLYAESEDTELHLYAVSSNFNWDGYSDSDALLVGEKAMLSVSHEKLYAPVSVYAHRQVPFLTMLYLNPNGNFVRNYYTKYGGYEYDILFFSATPITAAQDEEYRRIIDLMQFVSTDHVVTLADEPTTDPGTGVTFLLPDLWRYSGSEETETKDYFSLIPESDYLFTYTDKAAGVSCFRFRQSDLPHLDGLTDPKEIAAAVISRNQDATITPDMLEWRNFKGNEYYNYRPAVPGFLNYTDLMVHVRDDQVYLFTTQAPLDSPLHKDFMAMMGTVEFGPFATTVEINEAEPVEAPAELPEIDTSGLRTIMLWAVGILLAVLVGVVLFLLLVIRKSKPKPKPEPVPTGHFCPYCGKALEDDTQFCPYCGKQL